MSGTLPSARVLGNVVSQLHHLSCFGWANSHAGTSSVLFIDDPVRFARLTHYLSHKLSSTVKSSHLPLVRRYSKTNLNGYLMMFASFWKPSEEIFGLNVDSGSMVACDRARGDTRTEGTSFHMLAYNNLYNTFIDTGD
ncbi:hypothetical protein PM082_002196 [Marasmius tenuissimus]|nr:hypothetical protein PM082_002196 [Marasmius tenuissimus]